MATCPSEIVAPLPVKPRTRRRLVWCLLGLALLVALAWEPWRVLLGANTHVVVPGAIYRSAWPSRGTLAALQAEHGIRTVINLCGQNPPEWHRREVVDTRDLGLLLRDITFPMTHVPTPREMRKLVKALDEAEYPLLIHCRRGADRTGLACALALLLRDEIAVDEAKKQLRGRYGHWFYSPHDRVFDLYEAWLQKTQQGHDRATLRHWLLKEYPSGPYRYQVEEATVLDEPIRTGEPIRWKVRLRNTSEETWRFGDGDRGMRIGYSICKSSADEHGREVEKGFAEHPAKNIQAGEVLVATVVIPARREPGQYEMRIELVEGSIWFSQLDVLPLAKKLMVRE